MVTSYTSVTAITTVLALASPTAAMASPGTLDPQFGNRGVFQEDLSTSGGGSSASAVLALPGGRLLSAGVSSSSGGQDFVTVARHLPTGGLDRSFGANGIARATLDFCDGVAASGAVAAAAAGTGGRVVVAGRAWFLTDDGEGEWMHPTLAAFTATGDRDTSFGSRGVLCERDEDDSVFEDVIVQRDGKIVAVGTDSSAQALVMRYLPNGQRDSSFGVDGVVRRQYGSRSSAAAVAPQADGKLLLVGSVRDESGQVALVARINEDGTPDSSFGAGSDRSVRLPFEGGSASDVALDTARHILVAGEESTGESSLAVLARLDLGGRLDPGFGSGGVSRFDAGSGAPASTGFRALAPQPDGKIVAAGYAMDNRERTSALMSRFDATGNPDVGFGTAGTTRTQHGYGDKPDSWWTSVTVDSSGRILAAGPAGGVDNSDAEDALPERWTVARFLGDPIPGPPSPPERPATVPRLSLPASALVRRGNLVRLRVRCSSTVRCRGSLELRRNGVRFVRIAVDVRAGAGRTWRLRLSRTARRVIRRHRTVTVRAITTLRRAPEPSVVAVSALRLRRSH